MPVRKFEWDAKKKRMLPSDSVKEDNNLYAKKGEKQKAITSLEEMKRYIAQGYDIFDDRGNIVKHNPANTIAYTEYQRLMAENDALRAELAELHQQIDGTNTEPPIGDEPSIPPEDVASPKTLPPPAEDSTPKMGGKAAKAKAASSQTDGGVQ